MHKNVVKSAGLCVTEERILNINGLLHIWKESKSALLLHRVKLKCELCNLITRPGRNEIES